MITEIQIFGFKSIKSQIVPLRKINVLIGGNGVGKSNFISVFSLTKNLYEGNLEKYVLKKGGADSFLYFGKKNTNQIGIRFTFQSDGDNNPSNKFFYTLSEARDSLVINLLGTEFNSYGTWHQKVYEQNVRESEFRKITYGQAFYVNNRIREFEVYHFHDTGDNSPMKGKVNIDDNHTLRSDGSNIAAFLFYLKEKHSKHFLRIEKTIQSIAPFFEEFILAPNKLKEDLIQLEWREKGNGNAYFNAYHLSDGTLRFICLATLLLQPEPPKTIIIDEPELGLHPVAINKLASLIKKVSENVQVIISSQSVGLVDNFGPEDIIVANRMQNESVFQRLTHEDLQEWLKDYSLGEIWEKNLIGGQPFM